MSEYGPGPGDKFRETQNIEMRGYTHQVLDLAYNAAIKVRDGHGRALILAKIIRDAEKCGIDTSVMKQELENGINAIEDEQEKGKAQLILASLDEHPSPLPEKQHDASPHETPIMDSDSFVHECRRIEEQKQAVYRVSYGVALLEKVMGSGISADDFLEKVLQDLPKIQSGMERLSYTLRLAKIKKLMHGEAQALYNEAHEIAHKQKDESYVLSYLAIIPAYFFAGLDYKKLIAELVPVLDRRRRKNPYRTAYDELMLVQSLRTAEPEIIRPFLNNAIAYERTISGPIHQSQFIDRLTDVMLMIMHVAHEKAEGRGDHLVRRTEQLP